MRKPKRAALSLIGRKSPDAIQIGQLPVAQLGAEVQKTGIGPLAVAQLDASRVGEAILQQAVAKLPSAHNVLLLQTVIGARCADAVCAIAGCQNSPYGVWPVKPNFREVFSEIDCLIDSFHSTRRPWSFCHRLWQKSLRPNCSGASPGGISVRSRQNACQQLIDNRE